MLRDVSERDLGTIGARHARCPRRCCSRRSACSRSSIPTPSSPSVARPPPQGLPVDPQHRGLAHDRGRGRGDGRRRAAGISCTGPGTASSPRASSRAPPTPATARSSSRSTRGCSAGARATCRTPTCRSSKARASPTTSATLSSAPRSRRPPEEDPEPAIGHWAYQFANPSVDLGGPRVAARADRACRSCSRASCTPRTRVARSTPASTV